MTSRAVVFDGEIRSRDLLPVYDRDTIAYVEGGTVAADAFLPGRRSAHHGPRYAWTTGDTWTGNLRFLGSGVGHDNQSPVAIGKRNNNGTLLIYESGLAAESSSLDILRDSHPDILKGQADEDASYYYNPGAGAVIHGLCVAVCEKMAYADDDTEAIAVVTSQDEYTTATLLGDGDELNGDGTYHGWDRVREWSISWSYTSGNPNGAPTDVVVCIADYILDSGETPTKPGGQVYLFRATRASATGTWTVQPLVKVFELVAANTHCHGVIWINGRLYSLWGDTSSINCIRCHVPDDGIDNYTTTTWTTTIVHGGVGTEGAAGFQGVGLVQMDADRFLATGDVDGAGIVIVETNSEDTSVKLTPVAGQQFGNMDEIDGLFIHGQPAGPYVAKVRPTADSSLSADLSRVYYSEDGENWCTVGKGDAADSTYNPFMYGSQIGMASGTSMKYMPSPSVKPRTPLLLGPGHENIMRSGGFGIQNIGGTNTSALVAKSSVSPTAPTADAQIFHMVGDGSNLNLGQLAIADSVPTGDKTIVAYMKASEGFMAYGRARITDGSNFTSWFGFSIPSDQKWHPVIFRGDNGAVSPYNLRLQVQTDTTKRDADFYIAIGGVYDGDVFPTYNVAAGTTGDGSTLNADKALAATWTVAADLKIPPGWDSSLSGTFPLLTVYKDADNWQTIGVDTANHRFYHESRYGGSTTTLYTTSTDAYFAVDDDIRVALVYDGADYIAHAVYNGNDTISTAGATQGDNITGDCTIRIGADGAGTTLAPIEVFSFEPMSGAKTLTQIAAMDLAQLTSGLRGRGLAPFSGVLRGRPSLDTPGR